LVVAVGLGVVEEQLEALLVGVVEPGGGRAEGVTGSVDALWGCAATLPEPFELGVMLGGVVCPAFHAALGASDHNR
jgi:hypothetical protein